MLEQAQVTHVTLDFNGSCVPNPGQGGCGAVAYEEAGAALMTVADFPGSLQNTTNFTSAYTALLLGLRKLLKVCADTLQDPYNISLDVRSDYEVVIKQLRRENGVKALHLQVYYAIVTGLLSRFRSFTATKITSKENSWAHKLAQQGAGVSVSIDGTVINASTTNIDSVRGGAVSMIDAKFLKSLRIQGGTDALRLLEDYDSFSYVRAREAIYYILGELPTLSFRFTNDTASSKLYVLSPVYVVDRLPVPLHIHYDEQKMTMPLGVSQFTKTSFPGYEDHPHWKTADVPFPWT
ncbi:hypothetical protein HDU87_000029 [Geranomyces variabilis]|uniref:RNase H type-1 domain-containing protein n=1 Tax=Geranomyces variabilis TaxID=109894 RepID=A0AAD5XR13_9FUNG|nr:hypothetical protein HDU87_000029 [Geranomyces variabilis]